MFSQITAAADFLLKKGLQPKIGIVLGTGLGKLVNEINIEQEISYSDIPHFPVSTVESHAGKLIYGSLSGKKVVVMQGRFHYYEGYNFQQVVFPVRVMKMLGIQYILLSNAAGAINPEFKKGMLMVLDDHINLQPGNPLIGKNEEKFGTRFPDMSQPYTKKLNELLFAIAKKQELNLCSGIYAAVPGPMLETRAEYRYIRRIGADAVGMSTVPEVIAAVHMGLKCCAVSVLTDECDPDNLAEVNIADIIAVAQQSDALLSSLYKELVNAL